MLGTQTVRVRGKQYKAVAIRSRLTQAGHRFGSGTRTAWFAPGKGLVKLVFKHARRQRLDRRAGQVVTRPAAPGRPRPSRSRPRRAAALLAAALIPAALFAAGCGGGEDPERAEVRAYLERVNDVQTARKDVLVRADTVLRGYAQGATIGAPALEGVEADVRRVRDAVAAVSRRPPPATSTTGS